MGDDVRAVQVMQAVRDRKADLVDVRAPAEQVAIERAQLPGSAT